MNEWALSTKPTDVDRVKLVTTRGGNLFGLNSHTGLGDVVDLGHTGPSVAREVSNGTVFVAVVVVMNADVSCEAKLGIGRVSLDVDERTLGPDDITGVARDGVVHDGGRRTEDVNGWTREIATVHL